MGAKSTITKANEDPYKDFDSCLCGMSVNTAAYIIGFLGMLLSGIGFIGSISIGKKAEAFIEGVSALTYMCVFLGRWKNNHHYYLPLLIVHALAIPVFTTILILAVLVNFKFVRAKDFPMVLNLKFTIELTEEGLFWTAYNVTTTLIELYFFNIAYRAYMFMRRVGPKK